MRKKEVDLLEKREKIKSILKELAESEDHPG
jgi:hypothetical protein